MTTRRQSKLLIALHGYTTEQVLASRHEAGEGRAVVAITTFKTGDSEEASIRYGLRTNGGTEIFTFLGAALRAYAEEE